TQSEFDFQTACVQELRGPLGPLIDVKMPVMISLISDDLSRRLAGRRFYLLSGQHGEHHRGTDVDRIGSKGKALHEVSGRVQAACYDETEATLGIDPVQKTASPNQCIQGGNAKVVLGDGRRLTRSRLG